MGGIPFRAGEYDLALVSDRPLHGIASAAASQMASPPPSKRPAGSALAGGAIQKSGDSSLANEIIEEMSK